MPVMRALAVVLALGVASEPLAAQARHDGRRTTDRLLASLGRGAVGLVSRESLAPLAAGGLLTGYASAYDAELRDEVADPDSSLAKGVGAATSGVVTGIVVSGLYLAGRRSESPRLRAFSYDLVPAVALAYGSTAVLKEAVGRERPNGEDHKSFPSGHSSNAFALASVIESHYGGKAGAIAYPLAAFVGFTRIRSNKRYLSDVVAGATLGFIVGRSVVRVNGEPLDRSARGAELNVTPLVSRGLRGLRLSVAF